MRTLLIVSRVWGALLLVGFLVFVNIVGRDPALVLDVFSYMTLCVGAIGSMIIHGRDTSCSRPWRLSLIEHIICLLQSWTEHMQWLRVSYALLVFGIAVGIHSSVPFTIAIIIAVSMAGYITFDVTTLAGSTGRRVQHDIRPSVAFVMFLTLLLGIVIPVRLLASGADEGVLVIVILAILLNGTSFVLSKRDVLLTSRSVLP